MSLLSAQGQQAQIAGGQTAQQLPAFRTIASRHRVSTRYQTPFTTGAPIYVALNNNGLLAKHRLNVNLTVTVGTAGTVTDADQKDAFFDRLNLRSPQGTAIHSYQSRSLVDWDYRLHAVVTPQSDPSYAIWAQGTASAQAVNVKYEIDYDLNGGLNFEQGLIMRQLQGIFWTLELFCTTPGTLVGAGTCVISSITGTVVIEEDYYEYADPKSVSGLNFAVAVQLRDRTQQTLGSASDTIVRYDPGPVLLDAMHRFVSNSVADHADVARLRLLLDIDTTIDDRTIVDMRRDFYQHLQKNLRTGIVHAEFFDDGETPNQSRGRDALDSNQASSLEWDILTASGWNSTNSNVTTMYRELVTFGG
jgi:hypothetical protein